MDFGHLVGLCLSERFDPLTLCRIDPAIAAAIGASTDRVRLSHSTLTKQAERHSQLVPEDYRALPMTLLCGEYHQDTRTTAIAIFTDTAMFNRNFRACIKATKDGGEIWATSFFKLRDADMAAFRRKSGRQNWSRLREHD